MQIGFTIPAHNLQVLPAICAGFECHGSQVRTSTRSVYSHAETACGSTKMSRQHLSNLDRLLQKQPDPNPPDPYPVRESPGSGSIDGKGKGVFEGLSLSRIWPEMKAAEEMSPRHLNRLRRLLSMSSTEYSPRNVLGSRWREYHGCNDWAGLLDPLDQNLRREMVRYGEFVQAAYHCFHSDPATSPEGPPPLRHVSLPDTSYRVTKSLYATPSIGLPKWVDDAVPPDLGWMTQRTSWIGYVAVCEDPKEIARMGRRDVVIALRGTATCLEWAENMREKLVQIQGQSENPNQKQPKVECGFLSLFKTCGNHVPSLAESVVSEVRRLMKLYEGEALSITVTGHSLGAALALLVADELATCEPDVAPVAVFSFGGPRVGNAGFAHRITAENVKVLRIVNTQDVITRVPGIFVSEALGADIDDSDYKGLLKMLDNSTYVHVGTEMRLDTRNSPYLKPNADVACCHDLEAYLHLVDGFLATNCPFRSNAKRSLVKLLHEQGSNVKKLYTSKAKGLRLSLERNGVQISNCLPSPS